MNEIIKEEKDYFFLRRIYGIWKDSQDSMVKMAYDKNKVAISEFLSDGTVGLVSFLFNSDFEIKIIHFEWVLKFIPWI